MVKGSKKLDVSLFDLMAGAVLAHSLGFRSAWRAVLRCCRMLPEAHVRFVLLGLVDMSQRDRSPPARAYFGTARAVVALEQVFLCFVSCWLDTATPHAALHGRYCWSVCLVSCVVLEAKMLKGIA